MKWKSWGLFLNGFSFLIHRFCTWLWIWINSSIIRLIILRVRMHQALVPNAGHQKVTRTSLWARSTITLFWQINTRSLRVSSAEQEMRTKKERSSNEPGPSWNLQWSEANALRMKTKGLRIWKLIWEWARAMDKAILAVSHSTINGLQLINRLTSQIGRAKEDHRAVRSNSFNLLKDDGTLLMEMLHQTV